MTKTAKDLQLHYKGHCKSHCLDFHTAFNESLYEHIINSGMESICYECMANIGGRF